MDAAVEYKFLPAWLADSLANIKLRPVKFLSGGMQGPHKSNYFGSSVEFAEYRQYAPGDPVSSIDWAVYARSDRHVVRRHQEEINIRAYVLLDTSESLAFKEGGPMSKMDYACHLAAGMMYVLARQRDSVGLFTFDTDVRTAVEPVRGFSGLRSHLLALEELKPHGKSDLEASLMKASELVPAKSLLILISDLLAPPEQILRAVRRLHHQGHETIVFQVLDAAELALAMSGLSELRELETGSRMLIDADELRDAYQTAVERYLEELRSGFSQIPAAYVLADTRKAVSEVLAKCSHI